MGSMADPRMEAAREHLVEDLKLAPGELSFEARVGGRAQRVWLRTDTPVMPTADAALAACLMPAMRSGGKLTLPAPISPRVLRTQREFQAIQCAWSLDWEFGAPPLRQVEVVAPARAPDAPRGAGRVAAFFSGGVDSWSTVLDHPEITDLIFVRGLDLVPSASHQAELFDEVEGRLREASADLGLALHVVETNVREMSDPLARWEAYYGCAVVSVALFLAPLFERVLIAGDSDHEVQVPLGANRMVDQLWSTEQLEIVDDGGRYARVERLRRIVAHPVVQRTLRVCWENRDGAYNCGRCRKCLMTMFTLEALGAREQMATFPPALDMAAVADIEVRQPVILTLWQDVLDAARAAGRPDLERVVERVVAGGQRRLGLPTSYRRRRTPGPPPTIRIAAVVPVWRQPQFLAGAVSSALDQEISVGVGVVIVNDGCPFASTHRTAQTLRDAHPDRVAYLRQPNRGLSSARNAGIRHALGRWPQVEAVFPLDADNRLSRHTLAKLWALLEDRSEAAWASPVLEHLGGEDGEWRVPGSYLTYRQLFQNQSDAGSLIRRAVFEAGIEFDEAMRHGFEDWEFFLHATLAGFSGSPAGRCGFRYRRRAHSMLADAQRRAEEIALALRRRHRDAYAPRAQTRREHFEAPRFALVRCDTDDVLLTASCDLAPDRLPLPAFAERVRTAGGGPWPVHGHVPAITVLVTAATVDWLAARRLLAGVLLRLQVELRRHTTVGLRITRSDDPAGLELTTVTQTEPGGLSAVAVRTRTLAGRPPGEPAVALEVRAGGPASAALPDPLPSHVPGTLLAGIGAGARSGTPDVTEPSHAAFFEARHIDALETTLPWSGAHDARTLLVVVPWWRAFGLQRWLPAVVSAARALDPSLSAHLVLTATSVVEGDAGAALAPFDTLTPLGGADPEAAARVLERLIAGADAVLHAGTPDGYAVLPGLASEERGAQIVLASTISARAAGEGHDVLAARCYEPFIDAYLATSQRVARNFANLNVVPDKIVSVPPAPPVRPSSELEARSLARGKVRRRSGPDVPLRILAEGRSDLLHAVAAALAAASVRCELTSVRADADAEQLTGADALLLATPGPGALSLALAAMAFGCVVVAAGPGELDEVIEDGETGLLIGAPDEDTLVRRLADAVARIATSPDGLADLRATACEQALAASWEPAGAALLDAIATGRRHRSPASGDDRRTREVVPA